MLHKKALIKAITWRILSMAIGFVISFFYLDSFEEAGILTVMQGAVLTIAYYYHELLYKQFRTKGWI